MKFLLVENQLIPLESTPFSVWVYFKKQEEKTYLRLCLPDGNAYEYPLFHRPLREQENETVFQAIAKFLNRNRRLILWHEVVPFVKEELARRKEKR